MMKGFSVPLCSSLAIIKQSAAGTWGCGWIRRGEEEQSRMLSMSSTPQRRRRGREGGQHGSWFALCLYPLLYGFFSISFFLTFLLLLCLQLLSQICCIYCGISIFLENQILFCDCSTLMAQKASWYIKIKDQRSKYINHFLFRTPSYNWQHEFWHYFIYIYIYTFDQCFLYEFTYLRYVTLLSVTVYVPMCTVMSQHKILKI